MVIVLWFFIEYEDAYFFATILAPTVRFVTFLLPPYGTYGTYGIYGI